MSPSKEIMVLPRDILFRENSFQGFQRHSTYDFQSVILSNQHYMARELAENNHDYKQPICYLTIINPYTKDIFAYRRSQKDKDYSEKRLQGKLSIGIGGHIERKDSSSNPILESLVRELDEEVRILGEVSIPQLLGYINDDSNDVGRVHFGLLYYVSIDARTIKPKDPEIASSRLYNYKRLFRLCTNKSPFFKMPEVETWAKIAIHPIFEFMKQI